MTTLSRRRSATLAWVALLPILFSGCTPGEKTAQIRRGAELFQSLGCAACHGADGRGAAGTERMASRPRDLTRAEEFRGERSMAGIGRTLHDGMGMMPPYPFLPPADRDALAAFILSLAAAPGEPHKLPSSEKN